MAAVLVAAGLVVVLPQSAFAASPVRWDTTSLGGQLLGTTTAPDGSVTATCASSGSSLSTKTFLSAGTVLGSTTFTGAPYNLPAFFPCDDLGAVGADGALYGADYTGYPTQKLASFETDGTAKWSQQVTITGCANSSQIPGSIRIGSDGNVYVGSSPQGGSCSQASHNFLTSYTPSGSVRWQADVGSSAIESVAPYVGGVVVGANQKLYYFENDGTPVSVVDVIESSYVGLSALSVGADGSVAVGVQHLMPPACNSNYTGTTAISKYDSSGLVYRHTPPDCTYSIGFRVLSDGDVSFMRNTTDNQAWIVTLNELGNAVGSVPTQAGDENGRMFLIGANFIPDTNGNLLVWRRYSRQGGQYRGVEFMLINPRNGDTLATFRTDEISMSTSFYLYDGGVSMAQGILYFTILECASYQCSSSSPAHLYAVNMAKLGMDYPRGAVLGVDPVTFDTMSIAGDSFSAGIGSLAPGQSYTDVPCSRSPNAYGPRLNEDPAVKLQMPATAFVACSGAVTDDVLNNQVGNIPANAKSVFLTIGGNNVKFPRLAAVCIFLDCSSTTYQDEFEGYLDDLQADLVNTYQAVLDRASGATVYVMGYPHILPLEDCTDTGSGGWWFALQAQKTAFPNDFKANAQAAGLTSAEAVESQEGSLLTISNDEAIFANTFENQLNLAISDAVDEVASNRLVFVSTNQPGSPLAGHQLCSEDPDFNGLSPQAGETFHPNLHGQGGLYEVARAALEAHQSQYVLAA